MSIASMRVTAPEPLGPFLQEQGETVARGILGPLVNAPTVAFLLPHAARMRLREWECIQDLLATDPKCRADFKHLCIQLDNLDFRSTTTMIAAMFECNTLVKAINYMHRNIALVAVTNFISNNFFESQFDRYGKAVIYNTIEIEDPKTGQWFGTLQNSSSSEVEEAIDAANTAFKTWSRTTRAERSKYLQRIASLIQEHRELFAVWESIDQGKTINRARIEVDRAISNFTYVTPLMNSYLPQGQN